MKSLSENIVDFYIRKNIIDSGMRTIYEYGISLIINDIVNFALILSIAGLLGHFLYGIVFLLTFCLARVHCGGFHANKTWICRCTMLVTFACVLFASDIFIKYCNFTGCIIITGISMLMLFPVIPVENPNKKINDRLRKRNKILGMVTVCLFTALALILTAYKIREGVVILFTILSVATLALIGKIINNRGGVQDEKYSE